MSKESVSPMVAVCVVGFVFTLFFLHAGWPPPDVNEAHYLAKARHYWNPTWCAGDQFLESADAHLVFYWTCGWLTKYCSLPVVAWGGRVVTWGLLAWSWQRLSAALLPDNRLALLTAAVFTTLVYRCHMAGEWVVGGVEAKGFAYVLVLLGLREWVLGREIRALLLNGAAASFHVLVGGWSLLALTFAWCALERRQLRLKRLVCGLTGGILLALPGLIPALALTIGSEPETVRLANYIYVFERLPHHVLIRHILDTHGIWFVARHLAVIVAWLLLAWWGRRLAADSSDNRTTGSSASQQTRFGRLNAYVGGAILIAVMGVAIEQLTITQPDLAARLLRYYWYRLSDVMAPLGAAFALGLVLQQLKAIRLELSGWLLIATILLCATSFGNRFLGHTRDFRPLGVKQSQRAIGGDFDRARDTYEDWVRLCRWISDHTPTDACFVTPRHQQTFKWYAGRREVASWKDVPQDAASLVQWSARFRDVYRPGVSRHGFGIVGREALVELGRKYGAGYIVSDTSLKFHILPFRRVYPQNVKENPSYYVYELPAAHEPQS